MTLSLAGSASRDFCEPAVDVMFLSAAKPRSVRRTLAVVLSGMGKDGLAGARAIAEGECGIDPGAGRCRLLGGLGHARRRREGRACRRRPAARCDRPRSGAAASVMSRRLR